MPTWLLCQNGAMNSWPCVSRSLDCRMCWPRIRRRRRLSITFLTTRTYCWARHRQNLLQSTASKVFSPPPSTARLAISPRAGRWRNWWPRIFGIGALIGSVIYVSHPVKVARQSSSTSGGGPVHERKMVSVGRITGMVDCKWADESDAKVNARMFRLVADVCMASGLMEITYDTGAKVILQGPVTYEVEPNGGYLAIGKLTGKLEKKAE